MELIAGTKIKPHQTAIRRPVSATPARTSFLTVLCGKPVLAGHQDHANGALHHISRTCRRAAHTQAENKQKFRNAGRKSSLTSEHQWHYRCRRACCHVNPGMRPRMTKSFLEPGHHRAWRHRNGRIHLFHYLLDRAHTQGRQHHKNNRQNQEQAEQDLGNAGSACRYIPKTEGAGDQ